MAGEMAECGVIETKAIPDLFDKVTFLRRRLAAIYAAKKGDGDDKEATTWVVGIEDFLKSFGGAQWRTSDIMKLACLNSLVSYECWHLFFGPHQQEQALPPTLEFGEPDDEFALQHLSPEVFALLRSRTSLFFELTIKSCVCVVCVVCRVVVEKSDEANEDDETSYMTFGTGRPFKVHPSQVPSPAQLPACQNSVPSVTTSSLLAAARHGPTLGFASDRPRTTSKIWVSTA
jgi:hypothetical protein